MKIHVILVATCLILPATAIADPPPAHPVHILKTLPWTTGRGYYPREAAEQELSGAATVICKVADTGRLTDCVAIKEDPANVGFGEATVREAEDLIVADTTQDKPGDWVIWTARFSVSG
jgi:hypothetical protein